MNVFRIMLVNLEQVSVFFAVGTLTNTNKHLRQLLHFHFFKKICDCPWYAESTKHCWYSENGKTAGSVLLNAQLILLLCLLHHVTTYHTCKLNIQQYRRFYISKNCHHNQEDLCILYYVFVKHLQIIIIIHLIHADCTVRFIASNKK